MTSSKGFKSFRDNKEPTIHYKNSNNSSETKIRVLQFDLVFVNGLPSHLSEQKLLEQDIYFGRYGTVSKSIINPPYPYKQGKIYQAYATYSNQLEASLAIVALDGFSFSDKPLKVSYGTTKYCSHFLKGRDCLNEDCIYLHQFDRSKEVINGDTATVFKQQNSRAIDMVLDNLQVVIEKILNSKHQAVQDGFPSLTEMIDFLIDSGYIDANQYEDLYYRAKKSRQIQWQNRLQKKQSKKQNQLQRTAQMEGCQSSQSSDKQDDVPQKLVKCNSFSTMASPSKISNCFSEESNNQNQNQFNLEVDSIDYKIEQKIIKTVLSKKVRSRLEFVDPDQKCQDALKEVKKIQAIIKRVLITSQ